MSAEFFDLPRLDPERLNRILEIEGMENLQTALGKKKGILLFGAHFGNWELMAVAASQFTGPMTAIYRPLDNPFLDRVVRYVRSSTGNIVVPKRRAMLQMLRALDKGGAVGVLIDQNVSWREGIFVDFFGRPACTTDGLARWRSERKPRDSGFYRAKSDGRYR